MNKYEEQVEKMLDKRVLIIGILFFLALILRIAKPFTVDRISKDGVLYAYMANDIADGHIAQAIERNRRMPPLYIFMLAELHKMGLRSEIAGILISIIAGSLLIIPVYLIAAMIFSSRLAAMASFLVAVNPSMIASSGKVMRDSLFLVLLFTAVYLIIKALKSESWNLHYWISGGLFCLLSVTVRNEGFEIIGITILAIIIELFFRKRDQKPILPALSKWSTGVLVLIMIYYIASLPFTAMLKDTSSTWSVIDQRIPGYFRTLLHLSSEDALKAEDTI